MNFTLLDYQEDAVEHLDKQLARAKGMYHGDERLRSTVALSAPPGAGKTVIMAAVLEHLFRGSDEREPDYNACVLWITDSPALNKQTYGRFLQASDILGADVPIDIIDSKWEAEKFAPGKIYFVNRQLLGKDTNLMKRSDKRKHTFYDAVGNTIDDAELTLYMVIDEAHRGIGRVSGGSDAKKTIYQTLISGYDGENHAMPVVVGVSATPKAFKEAMEQSSEERYHLKDADIDPGRVQEGGLLKDSIRLVAPGEKGDFQSGYIRKACHDLAEMTNHWNAYCDDQGIRRFKPAMLFQVEDKVSLSTIEWIVGIIREEMKDAVASPYSMVNTFGERQDIVLGNGLRIGYKEPEDIDADPDAIVVFAKTAISNGWDCPRAEVIISSRPSKSETDIEQILGRVIRTPLARTIDGDELLNEVSCYLPFYDAEALQRISKRLVSSYGGAAPDIIENRYDPRPEEPTPKMEPATTNEVKDESASLGTMETAIDASGDDEDRKAGTETRTNSGGEGGDGFATIRIGKYDGTSEEIDERGHVEASEDIYQLVPNPAVPRDVVQVFATIPTELLPKKPDPPIDQLFILANLLAIHEIDQDASTMCLKTMVSTLDSCQIKYGDAYQRAYDDVTTATSIQMVASRRHGEIIERTTVDDIADSDMIADAYASARKKLGDKLANEYRKHLIAEDEDIELEDATKVVAACSRVDEIVAEVEGEARKQFSKLLNQYDDDIKGKSEVVRVAFDDVKARSNEPQKRDMTAPGERHYSGSGDAYNKHVIADSAGRFMAQLNKIEKTVVMTETLRTATVAWYRNTSSKTTKSLCIARKDDDGTWQRMFPDFVFFSKTDDGIKPSIVDPHGCFLADAVSKLKALARYAEQHGEAFKRIEAVDNIDEKMRKLDLTDARVRKAVEEYVGTTAEALYRDDDIAQDYYVPDEVKKAVESG